MPTGTVNGVNYAKATAPSSSSDVLDAGQLAGKVRVINETYVFTSELSAATIKCGQELPKGAIVLFVILSHGGLGGTAGTLAVGDEASSTRYLTAAQATTAAIRIGQSATGGVQYTVTGVTDNIILINVANTLSAGTIKLTVFYTDN